MPATSPASRRPSGRRSPWQQPKTPSDRHRHTSAPTGLSGHALRQQFASSLRASAGSDDARMPQPTRGWRALAQGRPHVTGSPRVKTADRATRSATRPLSAGYVSQSATWCTQSHGSMAHLDGQASNRKAPSTPSRMPRRRTDDFGTNREWCPGSLVVSSALRRSGRTETLT